METLQEEKLQLHEAIGRYIVEKNNIKKRIKALEGDIIDHERKCEELENCKREMFDEHDERLQELGDMVRLQAHESGGLRT